KPSVELRSSTDDLNLYCAFLLKTQAQAQDQLIGPSVYSVTDRDVIVVQHGDFIIAKPSFVAQVYSELPKRNPRTDIQSNAKIVFNIPDGNVLIIGIQDILKGRPRKYL